MWHVLTIGAMITCGWLSAWQWGRAGSAMGSALNVGYGLQWPLFAVFFGYMWWHFLRLEVAKLNAPSDAAEEAVLDETPADETIADSTATEPAPAPSGPSPFGPRPATWKAPPVTDEEDPQLAAYNRMLAVLAARDAAR
jgi:DNA-binding transcriptional regulator of glucitol operon